MKIYHLKPIGGYKTDLRSDTLWGLLCWGIRHLYGEARLLEYLKNCKEGRPEFVISSTFPYREIDNKKVEFFPKPLLPTESDATLYTDKRLKNRLRKDLKEIQLLGLEDFKEVVKGTITEKSIRTWITDKENLAAHRKPPEKKVETIMHNTIDRVNLSTLNIELEDGTSRGQLYQSEEIYWKDDKNSLESEDNSGVFFLVKGNTEMILPVLRLYRHFGFGGNRSTGKGFFEAQESDFTIEEPSNWNALVNLSLYRPTKDEIVEIDKIDKEIFRFLLTERQGKIGFLIGLRQKSPLTYFKEGSIFPKTVNDKCELKGELINHGKINTDFDVYDNGLAFMVKIFIP
jgi:CRISPR-associated protein Csm4